jgi:hypothetical protein
MRMLRKPLARIAAGAAALLAAGLASAAPMVYTATLVTDVKVGSTMYPKAAVAISFTGDTKDIEPVVFTPQMAAALGATAGAPVLSSFCVANSNSGSANTYTGDGSNYFYYLTKGTTVISITRQGVTLNAKLAPGQVFVALDACNGGIGFGAFTGPLGLEVAYPVAFTFGTAMTVAVEAGASADSLSTPTSMSGNAWTCIGYPPTGAGALPAAPNNACIPPDSDPIPSSSPPGGSNPIHGPYALHSNVGDLFFYMPYAENDGPGSLSLCCNHYSAMNRGTLTIAPAPRD